MKTPQKLKGLALAALMLMTVLTSGTGMVAAQTSANASASFESDGYSATVGETQSVLVNVQEQSNSSFTGDVQVDVLDASTQESVDSYTQSITLAANEETQLEFNVDTSNLDPAKTYTLRAGGESIAADMTDFIISPSFSEVQAYNSSEVEAGVETAEITFDASDWADGETYGARVDYAISTADTPTKTVSSEKTYAYNASDDGDEVTIEIDLEDRSNDENVTVLGDEPRSVDVTHVDDVTSIKFTGGSDDPLSGVSMPAVGQDVMLLVGGAAVLLSLGGGAYIAGALD